MKYVLFFSLIAVFVFSSACHKSKASNDCEEPELDCANLQCIAHWDFFTFKLVDKVTGEDLLFGTNARYSTGNVKLFSDIARTTAIRLFPDSTNKRVLCLSAKNQMYLEIDGTNVYELKAEFGGADCCSNRVRSLQIDNNIVCICCDEVITLPVN